MSRIVTVTKSKLSCGNDANCGECRSSCQSACKTSCTVGNQPCEKIRISVKNSKKEQI